MNKKSCNKHNNHHNNDNDDDNVRNIRHPAQREASRRIQKRRATATKNK